MELNIRNTSVTNTSRNNTARHINPPPVVEEEKSNIETELTPPDATAMLKNSMVKKEYENVCNAIYEGADIFSNLTIKGGQSISFLSLAVRKKELIQAILTKYIEAEIFPTILVQLINADLSLKNPGLVRQTLIEMLKENSEKSTFILKQMVKCFYVYPFGKAHEIRLKVKNEKPEKSIPIHFNYLMEGLTSIEESCLSQNFLEQFISAIEDKIEESNNEINKVQIQNYKGDEIFLYEDPISCEPITLQAAVSVMSSNGKPHFYDIRSLQSMLLHKDCAYLKDVFGNPVQAILLEDGKTICYLCSPQELHFRDPLSNDNIYKLKSGRFYDAFTCHWSAYHFLMKRIECCHIIACNYLSKKIQELDELVVFILSSKSGTKILGENFENTIKFKNQLVKTETLIEKMKKRVEKNQAVNVPDFTFWSHI